MTAYYRPIPRTDHARPEGALTLAGGWIWFDTVEVLYRDAPSRLVPASDLPPETRDRLTTPRAPIAGLDFGAPQLMGILNVTPDSFSDGGEHYDPQVAITQAATMQAQGASIIDVGGESTRPGAEEVAIDEEIRRTAPVIKAIRDASPVPISIDTRKAPVARAAHEAGANLINDVAGFTFDHALVDGVGVLHLADRVAAGLEDVVLDAGAGLLGMELLAAWAEIHRVRRSAAIDLLA